jgi:hypothetical protein
LDVDDVPPAEEVEPVEDVLSSLDSVRWWWRPEVLVVPDVSSSVLEELPEPLEPVWQATQAV